MCIRDSERRVREPVDARGGVDARDPERAELALLGPPVLVGELHRAQQGFLGGLEQLAPALEIALHRLHHLLAAAASRDDGFSAWHGSLPFRSKSSCAERDSPGLTQAEHSQNAVNLGLVDQRALGKLALPTARLP